MQTWMEVEPEPPELVLTMTFPLDVRRIVQMISKAYVVSLHSIPRSMSAKIPNSAPNQPPISFLVWNVQEARSRAFAAALKEFNKTDKPFVLTLVETHMRKTKRRAKHLNHWVESMELIELQFLGASDTWAKGNSPETRRSAQLDRALYNSEWGLRFSNATVKHLPTVKSDHNPLFISPNGFHFRFQAPWMTHEKFQEFMQSKWRNDTPLIPFLKSFSQDLQ
ncbi:50S ribosomal protein L10 [Bienertia sinuspersici]